MDKAQNPSDSECYNHHQNSLELEVQYGKLLMPGNPVGQRRLAQRSALI
jgi:hypothetical protein